MTTSSPTAESRPSLQGPSFAKLVLMSTLHAIARRANDAFYLRCEQRLQQLLACDTHCDLLSTRRKALALLNNDLANGSRIHCSESLRQRVQSINKHQSQASLDLLIRYVQVGCGGDHISHLVIHFRTQISLCQCSASGFKVLKFQT